MCPGHGWCGYGGQAPALQRALLRAGVARCGGGGQASPGGGALRRCEGRLKSGACPPSAARPQGGLSRSATHVLWARVRAWGPSTVPLAGMPCGGLRAAGVVGGPSWGGVAFHRCEGRLMSGAVPPPTASPWGRAARTGCPCVRGTGGVGMGDPAAAPQRALLGACVARCGGGARASPGRLRCAIVRGVSGQALVLPQLPVLRAGCRGPLPTCSGHGCAGMGVQHCPFGLHALRGAPCRGGGGKPSRGGPAFHHC